MKKLFLIAIVALFHFSCTDFLEQKSQDEIIPTKVSDVQELIFGELISRNIGITQIWDVMSDDVSSIWIDFPEKDNTHRIKLYQFFTWQKDIENDYKNTYVPEKFYATLYKQIVLCNSLEAMVPGLIGTDSEKNRALAEIYLFRAWAYYDLANIYSVPYTTYENSIITPCVPINNHNGLGMQLFNRSTQREVYDLIEKDIETAVSLFENNQIDKRSIYRPGLEAACILATRFFLTEKKYNKVVDYANKITPELTISSMPEYVNQYGTILDLTNTSDYNLSTHVHFFNDKNSEIVFTYEDGYSPNAFSNLTTNTSGKYIVDKNLLSIFESGDLRRNVYFDSNGMVTKYAQSVRTVNVNNLRTVEALLNRAEAFQQMGRDQDASNDIQLLRNKRFNSTPPSIASSDLFDVIKMERRRELCFEGMRWNDLRRWGTPQITHDYYLDDNARKAVYTLQSSDAGYTFNLPREVLDLNPNIKRHERPERSPILVNL